MESGAFIELNNNPEKLKTVMESFNEAERRANDMQANAQAEMAAAIATAREARDAKARLDAEVAEFDSTRQKYMASEHEKHAKLDDMIAQRQREYQGLIDERVDLAKKLAEVNKQLSEATAANDAAATTSRVAADHLAKVKAMVDLVGVLKTQMAALN